MNQTEYLDALIRWTDYTLTRLGIGLAVVVLLAMACMCCVGAVIAVAILGGGR